MPTTGPTPLLVLKQAMLGTTIALALSSGLVLAASDTAHRIEAITLSSGGLAEIRRSIHVAGATELDFDVPLDQVNDILKSLLVRDPSGGVVAMTLDGLSPVEETFRRLPFTADDLNSLPNLLRTLQGVAVRASSGGRTIEGKLLGVETPQPTQQHEAMPESLLSVITATGQITRLKLRSDTELEILDEAIRESLQDAAGVSGQHHIEAMRTITLTLEGSETRDVFLDYVIPAPVWKAAYRLILDADNEARLQAWAIIENASGEDWHEVAVTLSSGAPVTLVQQLHQRYWHERPELPVVAQTTAAPRPDHYRGIAATEAQAADAAGASALQRPESTRARAFAPSAPIAPATADEGETAATYRLPSPVDLAAGRSLSVPFIDVELPVERIALFQPERGDSHPITTFKLENTTATSLPVGIMTVYVPHEEGYAGDTQLQNLPAGESRLLSFAADRKVEITTENRPAEYLYRANLAQGVLRTSRTSHVTTTYAIQGAEDAPRTVVIEHPRRQGWRFTSDALVEATPTHHRLRAEIEAGGQAEVDATYERVESESIALIDTDSDTLLYWSGQIDDAQTAETLARLAEQRQGVTRAETEIERIMLERESAVENQARIRENLAAVPDDSTLGQRYIAMLEEEEDSIAELNEHRQKAEERLAVLREEFAQLIHEL